MNKNFSIYDIKLRNGFHEQSLESKKERIGEIKFDGEKISELSFVLARQLLNLAKNNKSDFEKLFKKEVEDCGKLC